MYPIIKCGDRTVMEGIYGNPAIQVLVGDVILFERADGSRIIHRVISFEVKSGVTYYQTRGDNNLVPDRELVPHSMVIGRLLRVLEGAAPEYATDAVREYERVSGIRDSLILAYDTAQSAYLQSLAEYRKLEAAYQAGQASYQQVANAYNQLEQQRLALNALFDRTNEAIRKWKCVAMQVFPDVYGDDYAGTNCVFS